jgi:hypothetical protein
MGKLLFFFLTLFLPVILISQNTKKVIVIGIDGCRPDALLAANTPNIDNLIANGIFSPDALNEDITISGPGWSAILCGVWSDKHLVTNNSFNGNNYDTYPPFFKHINDFNSDLNTLSICHWSPINTFINQDYVDIAMNATSGLEVATEAANYLTNDDPDVVFLHFDDVDHAGHAYGFSPTIGEYISSIEGVDTEIGMVIQALEQRPNYADEDWLIMVTTDHGGGPSGHGGNSIEEKNIFVIASGNNIVTDIIEKDSIIISGNVQNCLGDSIELKFDGSDDYVQVAQNSIFDFGADQDFTIECRVRTTQAADVAIVGNKDWDSGVNKGFVFSFKYQNGPEWKVNIGDGNNRVDINTGGAIADGQWHTLSVSFDRDGFMKMYQDGSFLDSADISFIGDINTFEGLFFGADINSGYDYSGALAEIRVWNTVVDDQDIENWQCVSLEDSHPNYSNLIGYWKMNEGVGTVDAIDYSVNGNNGLINGPTWTSSETSVICDFSSTPRQTDVLPTVLTHLCIPIDTLWGLEGNSLIPECVISNIHDPYDLGNSAEFQIFPNPSTNEVHLHLNKIIFNLPIQLEVYNSIGNKIYEQLITTQDVFINTSEYGEGVYYFTIRMKYEGVITKKLIISSSK